jgi:hypothetical protein
VEEDIITAKFSHETEDEVVYVREVAVKIITTNAHSKTDCSLVSSVRKEIIPTNLAQNLCQSISELQYESKIRLINEEISGNFLRKND